MKLLDLLLGRRLANREGASEKITALEGLPAMGLDGLASSAYGPEAALAILAPLGVFGLAYMGPVMIAVLAVLVILYVSYWQTIETYPTSGGSFTVAHENLAEEANDNDDQVKRAANSRAKLRRGLNSKRCHLVLRRNQIGPR